MEQQTDTLNSKNTLVRSTMLLIILTVLSKLFGFGREMTQAYFFGANIITDAYLVAMTIPTVLFLAVSGAINNVFVPVYDRFRTQGRDKALVIKFALIGLGFCVLVFIIPVFLNTKFAVRLFAPQLREEGIALAAGMLRILIFIVFFRLFSAIGTAVLHVNRNFLVPGMVGIPYNLAIMGFSFFLAGSMGINALVWGTFAGVGIQFFILLPWLTRIKMGGTIRTKVSDGLKEIAFLLPPILMGSLAGQAKTMTDRIFASGLAEGSISFLNYANRIKELPVGLLIVTVITVLYPTLVSHANNQQWRQYRSIVANALNTMTFLLLPVIAGIAILALPLTQLIFMRGEFDMAAAESTAYALRFYSFHILGAMVYRLMVKAHYAVKDTKTPLYAMLISVSLNIVLNIIFIPFFAHGGLALATAIATLTSGLFMFRRLRKRIGPVLGNNILQDMGKSALATLTMAFLCLVLYIVLQPYIPASFLGKAAVTGGIVVVCAGLYFALAWFLKISAMDEAMKLVRGLKSKIGWGK